MTKRRTNSYWNHFPIGISLLNFFLGFFNGSTALYFEDFSLDFSCFGVYYNKKYQKRNRF